MARITLRQLLDHAAENDYGLPAYNINNMEQGLAIMEAAEAVNAPVIIQASRGARSYANDIVLAKLPANNALDYVTVHRYPNANGRAVEGVGRLMSNLRSTFGNKPVLLGEFGFSTEGMSPEESANHEIALYLQLLSEGLAGGGKWMLNDYPQGFNPKQNAYGAFRGDGSAKLVLELAWSDEATARVAKIPDFIRPMVMKEIERRAKGQGKTGVEPLDIDRAMAQWSGSGNFHGHN